MPAVHANLAPRAGRARAGGRLAALLRFLLLLGLVASPGASAPPAPAEAARSHWAFQPLAGPPPVPIPPRPADRPVDAFLAVALARRGLHPGPETDRHRLLRRLAFQLTGLPPTPGEIEAFLADRSPQAVERAVERYLGSPRFGERWGKWWLDAAGYADSNGYFNADTDRPLAHRYRDYVIRSLNRDQPFDQFLREQIAGDELAGWRPGQPATPGILEQLTATHFLRNGQDGSGESDGNPDEVRTDRYYALESALQILGSSLLGLTVQCAKCHDHKFEPFSQREYYALQAFFYPAFHVEKWVKPNDRFALAPLPGEREAWQAAEQALDAELADARDTFRRWTTAHRPPGRLLFADTFEEPVPLASRWSPTAPGDRAPGGQPPVSLDSDVAPGALRTRGRLQLIEGGGGGDRWLCTTRAFDWRPATPGAWIQATFDLVDDRLHGKGGRAERIGYFIAAHDFHDRSEVAGGNILIDGHPGGPSAVNLDYPGRDASVPGRIGATGYQPGRNYGVRITRREGDRFDLEHLVDGGADGAPLSLAARDLPPGAFGFEYCCGRSFAVDNVRVEASDDSPDARAAAGAHAEALARHRQELERRTHEIAARRRPEPGRIAWMTDSGPEAPPVPLLKRGNHQTPGDPVPPAFPAFLRAAATPVAARPTAATTGRRSAWVEWLLQPGSPQASLLARVTVNRVWQQLLGTGIVATPDNLGLSGAPPSHPELLDWLAASFMDSGWSLKSLIRQVVLSHAFRQSSVPRADALAADPANQLLWRFPVRRLDAEALRDAMLFTSGRLGPKAGGPYVPTPRGADGEVAPDESHPDAFSRTVFLQTRRTQVPTFLGTFDAPSIVFNCTRRAETTMPLQTLALLNSGFAVRRGADLAGRLLREAATDPARLDLAFQLVCGRPPTATERREALGFLQAQRAVYPAGAPGELQAWSDLGQALHALNAFLYLE